MKLKIRFVKTKGGYFAQKKTWLGWKDITYTVDMGYGSVVYAYTNKNKKICCTIYWIRNTTSAKDTLLFMNMQV